MGPQIGIATTKDANKWDAARYSVSARCCVPSSSVGGGESHLAKSIKGGVIPLHDVLETVFKETETEGAGGMEGDK